MNTLFKRVSTAVLTISVLCLGSLAVASTAGTKAISDVDFYLTLLHFNDGESDLVGEAGVGGVDRFATKMFLLRQSAQSAFPGVPNGVVTISSGDNFLAGPEFTASLQKPLPFYDSIGLLQSFIDVSAIGNHEFDFGPDVLADFISPFTITDVNFVSANLDFSAEPRLQALVDAGVIQPSVVRTLAGRQVGIVGATTPNLDLISSPRDVIVMDDVAAAVQSEIDQLTADGVNIIILTSHLQSVNEDLALIPMLSGVDIAIAGGGDELLANPDDLLVSGDAEEVFGAYPLYAVDADGTQIPVVTTSGQYHYIGRLPVAFDAQGRIVFIDQLDAGPQRVVDPQLGPDGVGRSTHPRFIVTEPVSEAVSSLDENIIGSSQVGLDGVRGNVRTMETNLGNLIADALLDAAADLNDEFGAPEPDVALQNGGGIRNDSVIPTGPITELDTFDVLPFSNFVSVVPDISRSQFKQILERAVSGVENTSGRFTQVAGFSFSYDASLPAQTLDSDGNVDSAGQRIVDVTLDDGTAIVDDGVVVNGDSLNIATIDFLARGGDGYPFMDADFITLGITYQQALARFIDSVLGGTISAVDYPEGGEGRITRLDAGGSAGITQLLLD